MAFPDFFKRYPKLDVFGIIEQLRTGEIPGIPKHLLNKPSTADVYSLRSRVPKINARLRIADENIYLHPNDGEESFHVLVSQTKDDKEGPQVNITYEGRFSRLADVG